MWFDSLNWQTYFFLPGLWSWLNRPNPKYHSARFCKVLVSYWKIYMKYRKIWTVMCNVNQSLDLTDSLQCWCGSRASLLSLPDVPSIANWCLCKFTNDPQHWHHVSCFMFNLSAIHETKVGGRQSPPIRWIQRQACASQGTVVQITLLQVIPTMTSMRFVTGKSSGILSDISSGTLSGISSGILSGISSGILPGISSGTLSGISSGTLSGMSSGISSDILSGKSSGICSGKHSGTLSGIPSGILSDILSGIPSGISSGILSGISSGILSGISSGTLPGISSGTLSGISSGTLSGISLWHIFWHSIRHSIWQIFWHMFWQTFWHFIWHTFWHSIWHSIWHIPSGILSGISSGILSGKHSCTLSGISSGILSDILSGVLSGISSGILSGRWGPPLLTELGGSQVEVQRCSLSSDGPRLRSSGAHSYRTPAVEVQQCPLHAEVGEELARRKWTWKWQKWTWKWMQRWWRRRRRRRRRRRTTLIKSNNPHLAVRHVDSLYIPGKWERSKKQCEFNLGLELCALRL